MTAEKKAALKVIKGARLIDGTGAKPIEDATILIEGTKIKAVGKNIGIPADARVINADGNTVMPGLIDSHMHFSGQPRPESFLGSERRLPEVALLKSISDAKALLEAGYTTVKDCGGTNAFYLKKAAVEGILTGLPRIVHASPSRVRATPTSGSRGAGPEPTSGCDGVPECIKATRRALASGGDFIKLSLTGEAVTGKYFPFDVTFNLDEVKAIVETAASVGRPVSAHCHNSRGVKIGIAAGVATIEHASEINDELIALAKERDIILTSTLAWPKAVADYGEKIALPPEVIARAKTFFHQYVTDSYRRVRRAGAVLAAGTDFSGNAIMPLGKNAVELELLVKYCEFTPMDAIVAATKHGALACFMGDKTGTIEPGKLADIIVVDGDPLADISLLQDAARIKLVMLEGRVEHNKGLLA